ncbi:pentatricopeptide repeat-containing protein At2g38420, mitochondrial [Lycium ferocissimum]|uniref:pentatricopeptide repeat-containing protein At2g38420, mitochondrial n=1 Tax=Lycium ferocissimum TaxID=112874 RepID=UPI002814DE79|nr:pentatricopeptide repeat-containing protein At2g38420, mitochondrial [Lycium ferocissimum]
MSTFSLLKKKMSLFRQSIRGITFIQHFSSHSSNVNNYYLRQKRKWPHSPYKTKYQDRETFTHQLAMQKLIQSTKNISPKTNLLAILIDSFSSYKCNPTPNAYFFILKTLTKNPTTWDQIPHILDHIHKVENFNAPEYIFTYLIKFYGVSNKTNLAFELFFTMPCFRCNPSVKSLNVLVWVIFKNNYDLRFVLLVLVKCQLMNVWVEESTFKILIKELCRIGKVKNCVDLLNLMVDSGLNLDESICSLILCTMSGLKVCDGIDIWGVLEEMRKLGYIPKRVDLCNVIRFYVKNGKGVDGLLVLNKMKMSGIMVPDIVCYNLVLNGLILEGEWNYADEVFDELLVSGLVPDIVTYNVYINGLCKQNKVDEALRMIGCMEDLGCKPETNTYYTILEALCRSNEMLSSAKEFFGQIKLKGLQLNAPMYGIMINCMIRNGEVDEAYNMLQEMVGMGFVPQSVTFDGLIYCLCERGLLSEVMELLSIMVAKNVVPGIGSWEALVQALSNSAKEDSSK